MPREYHVRAESDGEIGTKKINTVVTFLAILRGPCQSIFMLRTLG